MIVAMRERACDVYGCTETGEPAAEWTTNQGEAYFRMCEKHHEEYLERERNWHPGRSVFRSCWPEVDEEALEWGRKNLTIDLPVQINGKKRGVVTTLEVALEVDVIDLVRKNQKIESYLSGRQITRIIYVPGRIINFVVQDVVVK